MAINYNDISNPLKYFDPLIEDLPDEMNWDFYLLVERAHKLAPEIESADSYDRHLEYLRTQPVREILNSYLFQLAKQLPSKQGQFSARHAFTGASAVFHMREKLTLPSWSSDYHQFLAEIFAVLALEQLARCVIYFDAVKKGEIQRESMPESKHHPDPPVSMAIEAMEAIAYGEAIQYEWRVKERDRKIGRAVSKAKSEIYVPLKKAVIEARNKLPKDLSDNKAAWLIDDSLDADLRRLAATKDLHTQIRIWLGQCKKGTIANRDQLPPFKWLND